MSYGSEGGMDQSLVRFPEDSDGDFIQYLALPNAAGKVFSPGYFVNSNNNDDTESEPKNTIPEPSSLGFLMLGLAGIFFSRKKY